MGTAALGAADDGDVQTQPLRWTRLHVGARAAEPRVGCAAALAVGGAWVMLGGHSAASAYSWCVRVARSPPV